MRTVFIYNKREERNIEICMSYVDLPYVTSASVMSEIALRKYPLWKMLLNRCEPRSTSTQDLDRAREVSGDEDFYPSAKVSIDDDTLMEILLLATPEDRIVY